MGFLTFIFWCIVVFYVLGLVGRLLLRRFIQRKQREFSEQFDAHQQQYRQTDSTNHHEGDIKVERIKIKEKHVSGKVGEYVEYEEIKESEK